MAKSYAAKLRRANRRRGAGAPETANPAMAKAMAELRGSGAAGSHQGGVRGQRTRTGANEAAIREYLG